MRKLTDQVLAAANVGSWNVGDAEAPADTTRPYAVIYSLFDTDLDGPWNDDTADAWYEYQVTAVGDTRFQAQALSDALEPLILGYAYTVSGYAVGPVKRTSRLPIERDDDERPPLFYQTQMFRLWVTPS